MKKIFFLLLFIISGKIYCQVNLQTGSATFSLPMFNWQDDKSRLNSVVALSYNSGNGLKTDEIASNVGQGWNLLAGGVISRMQAGEPDDQLPKDGASEDDTKYPPGYLYNTTRITTGSPISLTQYPIYKDKDHLYKQHNIVAADRELDHFAFQFNGRSGVFVLSKVNSHVTYGSHTGEGVVLGDSKLKITFVTDDNLSNSGIRTTITSFAIQDENGLIYKFSTHELTKVLKTHYCDKNLNQLAQPKFKNGHVYYESSFDEGGGNRYIINGWYLTEIEDALTHRTITFTYENRDINNYSGFELANYTSNNSGIFTPAKNYSIISRPRSISTVPVISTISYPDRHKVTFNYDHNRPRFDLTIDYPLASVDITYQSDPNYASRFLARYVLTTSYIILNRYGTPVSDYQKACARLCLRAVKKIGVDLKADDPPYTFDYNLGSSAAYDFVPPLSFHLKDVWGYYNGGRSQNDDGNSILPTKSIFDLSNIDVKGLCFFEGENILSANPGYAKNGLLKQITYPTGGSLNYEYAQNTGILSGQTTTVNLGGVHVSKTSVTDGGYSNDCNHAINTSYLYTLGDGTISSLWGFEVPINSQTFENHYEPREKHVKLKFPYTLLDLTCVYTYQYPGIISREQAVSSTFLQQALFILSKVMNIYGTVTKIIDFAKYASGVTGPLAIIIDIILDVINIGISCIGDHHVDNTTNIYYNSDLNGSNSLPNQFKRVEVVENSGANGKTVYEFTSDNDYAIWTPSNPTFSSEQRYAYWVYGLPKKITILNAVGDTIKQTENVYDYTFVKSPVGLLHYDYLYGYGNCKALVIKSNSEKYTDWENPDNYEPYNSLGYPSGNFTISDYPDSQNPTMLVRMYGIFSGRLELQTSYERIFKPASSQYLETRTDYDYTSYNFQVASISTIQSNGDLNFKAIIYAGELSDNTGKFQSNNILNVPADILTGVRKNGSSQNKYLSEKSTEFTVLPNGDVKPSRILEKRFAQPSSTLNVPFKETQSFTYDASGNLIGMKDEGNHVVANIYNYNDKYIVASVVNASADHVRYTSFETPDNGGWTINPGSTVLTNNNNITGDKSLSGGVNVTVLQGNYILSFWSAANTWLNGQDISASYKVNLGPWKRYFEVNLNNITSVNIAGDNIDEVRLYPQNARMRTVTYDPLIGKTSECDENNRITYYEYDEHARLRFIRDENKNVVKMYEYNVAKKPTGCPVTYFNLAVSEIFTKECSAGYIGSTMIYTIPEGKYTSTVSQDEVDIQVQNELNTLGQAYANAHGTCTQLFYNAALSQTFTKEGCDVGYEGTAYTYTVPAHRYSSTTSQADADEKAQDDIDANGQALANLPGNTSCVLSSTPDWIGTGLEQCQSGHKLIQFIDQNPNSSTYNQTQWIDTGEDAECAGSGGGGCDTNTASGPNCDNEGYKWIYNCCEQGYKLYYTSTYYNGLWYCVYHYEFSDGSVSLDYVDWNTGSSNQYACLLSN